MISLKLFSNRAQRDTTSNRPTTQGRSIDTANVFEHAYRHLMVYRNLCQAYHLRAYGKQNPEIDAWANDLLKTLWTATTARDPEQCPRIEDDIDTVTPSLPALPPKPELEKILTTIILIHVSEAKSYSARTRAYLPRIGTIDESAIVHTLKNPDDVLEKAQKEADATREQQAEAGAFWRKAGMAAGAVAGGVLIGVTGGLAAPLVGAGLSAVLGTVGLGGTVAGVLATTLASSSIVCGSLFGAYGAHRTSTMIGRHTKDVQDLAIVPVCPLKDTLSVRLCVSGWLNTKDDVANPWKIFDESQDTFALQWEVDALIGLSDAFIALFKDKAIGYIQREIIKRTVLASLLASLSPMVFLQMGHIIDNPWSNAQALALKTGRVLGILLSQRVLGTRPVTLTGYSLGSLVIFEALKYLSALLPSQTTHLIDSVYLFGLPTSTQDVASWKKVRAVVSGRLVNGWVEPEEDYILAILSRASVLTGGSWTVAGLAPVMVKGIENVKCEGVEGHLKWVGMVGRCLEKCGADGVVPQKVENEVTNVGKQFEKIQGEAEKIPDNVTEEEVLQAQVK